MAGATPQVKYVDTCDHVVNCNSQSAAVNSGMHRNILNIL